MHQWQRDEHNITRAPRVWEGPRRRECRLDASKRTAAREARVSSAMQAGSKRGRQQKARGAYRKWKPLFLLHHLESGDALQRLQAIQVKKRNKEEIGTN